MYANLTIVYLQNEDNQYFKWVILAKNVIGSFKNRIGSNTEHKYNLTKINFLIPLI